MNNHKSMLRLVCPILFASLVVAFPARADVVSRWNHQLLALGAQSRNFAMAHVAIFDAINAIQPRYRSFLQLPLPPAGADPEAAAASAAYHVLVRLLPAEAAAFQATLNASLASVPDGPGKTSGIAYGEIVGLTMYQTRLTDNMLAPGPTYVATGAPGAYQITVPGVAQPVNTNAPNWIPFAMTSASQFRPTDAPALTSRRYADDVNEVQALGGLVSPYRTALDDETARWHTEFAHLQLNRIALVESGPDGCDLLYHARLFALLNLALSDAATSAFDAKYAYAFWRPVTAIRNADLDGNPSTSVDAGWSPFLPTPLHPEYPSAHSVIQTAGARVLTKYFGQHYTFEATSPTVPGVTRRYDNFEAFTREGGLARILGGMHFRHAIEVGQRQGKKVGNWILEYYLLPLDDCGGW